MTMPIQKPGRSKQDYGTPVEFLQAVKRRLNISEFSVDLAASDTNAKAQLFLSEEDNSLNEEWQYGGWCWLNPPFSSISPWVEKASNSPSHIAMLVPASVGANWWRDWVHNKAHVILLNGRLIFEGETLPYPKDCALLLYTPFINGGYEVWDWRQS